MRKLYREYFEVSPTEKISDKVMLTRVVFTALTMLICLAAMSFSAYAYFSATVSSSSSTITSASFDIQVQISEIPSLQTADNESSSSDTQENEVTVTQNGQGSYVASLEGGKTYKITLSPAGNASTGFCLICFEGIDARYTTQQLGKDIYADNEEKERTSLSFTVTPTQDTVITLSPCWGTSAFYSDYESSRSDPLFIKDNDTFDLPSDFSNE